MTQEFSRRKFLASATAAAVVAGVGASLPSRVWSKPKGANDAVRLGIVGLGRKGPNLIKNFLALPDVRIVALCDADQAHLDRAVATFQERNEHPEAYRDVRDLLDDKNVDAVVIATPNHWHALMTIWACQAGKHVYVEKPVSHDIWEGRQMLAAQKKYRRVVQGGTQNRSNAAFDEGLEYLRSGEIGEMQGVHGLHFKFRESIGRVSGPQPIPATVDYDLYCGPAPLSPLLRKELHYDWHWDWRLGNGDYGNNGAHTTDDVLRIMGDHRLPSRVRSLGGRFVFNDDGQTPNEQLVQLDYGEIPVFVEIRNLPVKPGASYMDNLRGARVSTIVECEEGYMVFGWGGATAYSKNRKRIAAFKGDRGSLHASNFIEAVRRGDPKFANCTLDTAVGVADQLHLANLSYRSGYSRNVEDLQEELSTTEVGKRAIDGVVSNLQRHGVDLNQHPLSCGSWVSLEGKGRALKVEDEACGPLAQSLFEERNQRGAYSVGRKI